MRTAFLFALVTISVFSFVTYEYNQSMSPVRETGLIPPDYFSLRSRFLQAAQNLLTSEKGPSLNATLQSFPIASRGPSGQDLAIDMLWLGAPDPQEVFLHISGTHGVEGYAGSAIQSAIIENEDLHVGQNQAIIFIHSLNPWGMAHLRRFNESNVDLNRNFLLDDSAYRGSPDSYRAVNSFLNPSGPPSRIDTFVPQALLSVMMHGYTSLKQAIAGGQYEYPHGIYYGGNKMEESNKILRKILSESLGGVKRMYVIEIHSGLGEWAKDVLFWPLPPTDPKSQWFSAKLGESLQSDAPEDGVGFRTPGDLQNEAPKVIPNTEVYWLLQEFGAYGPIKTLRALRNENRYHQSGGTDLNHWSKQLLVEAFLPASQQWQKAVIERGQVLFSKMKLVLDSSTN